MFLLLWLQLSWFWTSFAQEIRTVNVAEGEDALLNCTLNSGQNIAKFDWRKDNGEDEKKNVFEYEEGSYYGNGRQGQDLEFIDRVVFFQHELRSGNASIKIKHTRLEDNGTYTCGLLERYRPVSITLNVGGVLKIRKTITGAARVPYIKPVRHEITSSLLECKVEGVPGPEVEWRNSAGKVLAKHIPEIEGGYAPVELKLKVTRSDNYTCVATQMSIFHQINNTLEVSIPDVVAVVEGDDAVLPCSLNSKQNIENMEFSWRKGNENVYFYYGGRVEENKMLTGRLTHFQQELKYGNASLRIHKTQISDSGLYSCSLPNIQKSSHTILQIVGNTSLPGYFTYLLVGIGIIIGLICAVGIYFIKRCVESRRDVI